MSLSSSGRQLLRQRQGWWQDYSPQLVVVLQRMTTCVKSRSSPRPYRCSPVCGPLSYPASRRLQVASSPSAASASNAFSRASNKSPLSAHSRSLPVFFQSPLERGDLWVNDLERHSSFAVFLTAFFAAFLAAFLASGASGASGNANRNVGSRNSPWLLRDDITRIISRISVLSV